MSTNEDSSNRNSELRSSAGSTSRQQSQKSLREGSVRRTSAASDALFSIVKSQHLSCSMRDLASVDDGGPFILEGITSSIYGPTNPPKDWADAAFLIPHEALRLEMDAMMNSAKALQDDYDKSEAWKIRYFAEWYLEEFTRIVHDHHDNEEKIYFPWVATKAELPEKQFASSHKELLDMMDDLEQNCITIKKRKGLKCTNEIKQLKEKIPTFVTDMLEHLKEEEEAIPEVLRANFTHEEEMVTVQKLVKADGLGGARHFLPSILTAMKKWAKPAFNEEFAGAIPPPIKKLLDDYYMPDYQEYVCPKRDAPTLSEKPLVPKVKCCKIPFCCNCIV